MLIIGSAQFVNILISIFRMKALALMLGPTGVGVLSIFNNLQGTASEVADLGIRTSGVREIASVKGREPALSQVRSGLFVGTLVQGLIAMALLWVFRMPIAQFLFGNTVNSTEVGLVGVAVLFALIASAQTALLQGLRRIGELGRVTIIGAAGGTVVGLISVWLRGSDGLIWFVIVQPLAAIFIALHYTRKITRPAQSQIKLHDIWAAWKPMVKLGVVFMVGGLATSVTLLLVRGMIARKLGLANVGLFAASWGITMQYVGFLLGAMAADYYPRLTEVIKDQKVAARLMNEQMQIGLALGGPILLLLIGLAPWVMTLLYSPRFSDAAEMLQWQTVGNVFKLASWPLGFAFVAAAQSMVFLFIQVLWNALFLGMIWIGLPIWGLPVAGTAFLVGYLIVLVIISALARQLHGFRWEPLSLWLVGGHAGLAALLLGVALNSPRAAVIASPLFAFVTAVVGLRIVVVKMDASGQIVEKLRKGFALIGWRIA